MTPATRARVCSVALAALFLGAACGDADEVAHADDAPDCSLVPTPNGLWPKACVIGVPSGATVTTSDDGTTVVTLDGVVVATYPPCPCPHP